MAEELLGNREDVPAVRRGRPAEPGDREPGTRDPNEHGAGRRDPNEHGPGGRDPVAREPSEREPGGPAEHATAALAWWLDTRDSLPYRLRATGPWGVAEARGHDLWAALARVRGELETNGWLLAVNAARPDVLQSGMLRSSGSTRAYRVRTGRPASQDSMVDLFDVADADAVTTVADQSEAHSRWRASLRSPGAGT